MKRKVITLIQGWRLATLLWLVTPYALAQNCQLTVSHPEIQLGKQRHAANAATLFSQQDVFVTAECVGEQPIALLIDGTPDEGGQHFRFGATGKMTLSLLAAQYDGTNTGLRLSSAFLGESQLVSGSQVSLPPGSLLTVAEPGNVARETHMLVLRLRLDFPASGNEGRIRDLTELSGQLRFEVRQ